MLPTILQIERLKKLADHLKVCTQPEYNLSAEMEDREIEIGIYERAIPSHHGHVLEECLCVFPDEWTRNEEGQPVWMEDIASRTPISSAVLFFGLSTGAFLHLFGCGTQYIILFGGDVLNEKTSFQDIAKNITDLVETLEVERDFNEE